AAARGRATDRSARCRWFLFRKRVVTLETRGRGAYCGAARELLRRRLGVRERRDRDKTGEDRSRLDEPLHFCPPADRGRSAISINAATTNMPEAASMIHVRTLAPSSSIVPAATMNRRN